MIEEGKQLVRSAFEMARDSGKVDWNRMTIAVLKNRLLLLTDGGFSEAAYGASNMRDFVLQASDVARLDASVTPPVVELLTDDGAESDHGLSMSASSHRAGRIRPDLWYAIMDYSRGRAFVWDERESVAREQRDEDDPATVLPTIDAATHADWRREFATERQAQLGEKARGTVQSWVESESSSIVLPGRLRREWHKELTTRVDKIIRDWFGERGLELPPDYVSTGSKTGRRGHLEALRQVVLSCVQVMTEDELSSLNLPPTAVWRARRSLAQGRGA